MPRRSWLFRLAAGLAVVAGLVAAAMQLGHWRDARALRFARGEIEALLAADAQSAADRSRHAMACIRLSQPLVARGGAVGATAALFIKSAAPFASFDAAHVPIPGPGDVLKIPADDLLPATRLLVEANRIGVADQLLDVLLQQQGPARPEILVLAATVRLQLGRDMEVLAYSRELKTLRPDDPQPYWFEARVQRNHGRWAEFVEAAREVLKRSDPPDDELRLQVADGLLHQGLTAEARKEFDAIAERRPDLAERAATIEARLLIREGNLSRAETVLTAHLRQAPEDDEALILLGGLLVGKERFAEAVRVLEKAVQVAPATEDAHYLLSQAYARTGKPDRAKEMLARHRVILDTKVRLHSLETQAAREPQNIAVRKELVEGYEKIGLHGTAEFWRQALAVAQE